MVISVFVFGREVEDFFEVVVGFLETEFVLLADDGERWPDGFEG